jgi:hypothetical protein
MKAKIKFKLGKIHAVVQVFCLFTKSERCQMSTNWRQLAGYLVPNIVNFWDSIRKKTELV